MFAKITFLPAFCGMFTKITFIPMHARQNRLYSHLLPSQMSSYRSFGRSITIKNLPFLESPFRVRNIATSKWLATSTARMKMANMRANQDLGNTRDFGEHAAEGGNKRGFGKHTTEGGNKRDFSWIALEVEVGGGSSN